ncbi:MAG TPA: hypothetical protein PKI62_14865, partial [bacterium]|nr:hypothetical protein [bacterium]
DKSLQSERHEMSGGNKISAGTWHEMSGGNKISGGTRRHKDLDISYYFQYLKECQKVKPNWPITFFRQ